MIKDHAQPQAVEFEEIVLGQILLESNCIDTVIAIPLIAEHFYLPEHKKIYQAIIKLYNRKEPIHIVTVIKELKKIGTLESIGGPYYVTKLTNRVSSSENIEYHCRIIIQQYLRREAALIAMINQEKFHNESFDIFDVIEEVQQSLFTLVANTLRKSHSQISKTIKDAIKSIAENNGKGITGVPSGFTDLDEVMYGWQKQDLIIVAARPGMGKAQPMYSKILTKKGWTTMENVKIGDMICGTDGNEYPVTGIFPQGRQDVYRVTFDDGSFADCEKEHLWEVTDRSTRKRGSKVKRVISTEEIMKEGLFLANNRKNFAIKVVEPIDFQEINVPINPYLLGIYLAEGNTHNNSIVISNPEIEIINKIKNKLCYGDYMVRGEDEITNRINGGIMNNCLKELGLHGLLSYEKFIPKNYLYNTKEVRLALLQGILDGDGHVATANCIEYSTTSLLLRDQVIELVQGLGGKASWVQRMGKYKKDGKYIETRINYRVYITFNNSIFPVSTQKHLKRYKNKKQFHCRFIVAIEKIGNEECKCIMVKSPDHCYVTDNYIVTHNTSFVLSSALKTAKLKIPVAFFSLEMSEQQLGLKALSIESDVKLSNIRKQKLSEEELSKFGNVAVFDDMPLFIDDTPALSIFEFRAKARRLKQTLGIQLIIIDYLQLMTAKGYSNNREGEISYISRNLKAVAKELDIPIIALSQLSRNVEQRAKANNRPILSDLRESGAIEQDADMVMFLYRPEYYKQYKDSEGQDLRGKAEIIIAKYRNGDPTSVYLKFVGYLTKFMDLLKDEEYNHPDLTHTPIDEEEF